MQYSNAQHRTLGLVALALLALTIGAFVYLLDRPAGSTQLIPAVLQLSRDGRSVFGSPGEWLPSLVHIYAFILLTAAITRPSTRNLLVVCMGWLSLETFFELIQHPVFIEFFAGRTSGWQAGTPGLAAVHDYAAAGVFDPLDLGALVLGAAAAYVTARLAWKKEASS